MRWSLVCMPPNVTREVLQATVSELNKISITTLSFYITFYVKYAFPFSTQLWFYFKFLEGSFWWIVQMTRGRCGEAGGWWRRKGNDQHWFILDVLLSGWCRQNTSLHPIPSHYLPAITAVQRVSYRVINTSPRPHTASTSSSRRRLMTVKDRQCILSLVMPCFPLFIHILQWLKNVYIHHERPAAPCPPDFAFKMVH